MRALLLGLVLSAVCGLSACDESAATTDAHLDCAALISAANHLSVQGRLKTDSEFDRQALVSGMTHLNAHAIPNGIREAEAFDQLKVRRAELIDATSPSEILDRAIVCNRNTPGR